MSDVWLTVPHWSTDTLECDDYEISRDFDFAAPGSRESTRHGSR